MKYLGFILICFTLVSCNQTKSQNALSIDVSKDIVIPKHYIITKISDKIIIDGNADESNWESAKFSDTFIDIEGFNTPKYDTKVKMLWDDTYLYVYAELNEPHIWEH